MYLIDQLTQDQKQRLFEWYQPDFDMYGYSPEPFVKVVSGELAGAKR